MTTFGWKRKAGENVSKVAASKFQAVAGEPSSGQGGDGDDTSHGSNLQWLDVTKRRKLILLEDASTKSRRLKEEGSILAEAERYWEAIKKWDEALQLMPDDDRILEMKAQALMILHEVFPAVQAAEQAVKFNPSWWVAHQTLGRARLGLGEIELAIRSFSRAIHLNPDDAELWQEDLGWAHSLLRAKHRSETPDVSGQMVDSHQEAACEAKFELEDLRDEQDEATAMSATDTTEGTV